LKAVVVSLIIFTCIFGGAVVGMLLRAFLPERHLSDESRNVVTLGMGLVATMAALVLGFLIAGAQSNFTSQRGDLIEISAKVVFLDQLLAEYGPGAEGARETLRDSLDRTIDQFWPEGRLGRGDDRAGLTKSELRRDTCRLRPRATQRSLRDEALSITYDLAEERDSLLMSQVRAIPRAFIIVLAVLVFWFVAIFFSFGLYAPTNGTVVSTLILSALSVSLALFLILELNRPFEGLIRMPSEPLVEAQDFIGK
jgi:hypothetical protein